MTQSLQMRTASLGASMLLLGGALIAAMSLKYVLPDLTLPAPPPIGSVIEAPTPPPEPIREPITRPTPDTEPLLDTVGPSLNDDAPPTHTTVAVFEQPSITTITSPTWVNRPRDLERYYPRRALRMNVEGSATLNCRVSVEGLLNCVLATETPSDWGFGEAALRIAREYRMVPAMRNGKAIEARYVMRVPFHLE